MGATGLSSNKISCIDTQTKVETVTEHTNNLVACDRERTRREMTATMAIITIVPGSG